MLWQRGIIVAARVRSTHFKLEHPRGPRRSQVVVADHRVTTAALVLDEEAPLDEYAADDKDLAVVEVANPRRETEPGHALFLPTAFVALGND